ncbi:MULTISPECIES: hypothetical protein [Paenibacillus]|uniref:hypothetical protein n=1 Tax=Paenibacillus TaxID=44249 RepID=UPI0022B89D61|nr:hypothetical protein [Paenibacillus caseinilyticus]MCZ8518745.1 hypothetical protein [Paenibacillus caseinilyticus]
MSAKGKGESRVAVYWLVPLDAGEQAVVLGADRIRLEPEDRRSAFLDRLRSLHPRLPLTFKAHLLPGEEEAEACGLDAADLELSGGESIRLRYSFGTEEEGWMLSHCAEAYFDRLLTPGEIRELLGRAGDPGDEWLKMMRLWTEQGRGIIMLRED